ncbi:MaoC family dehydratase N-terminal domain-containing protein [Nonomuraea sp. SMC257]|uniref:MaoC family dehydratase N-terminal domain-containing protein n=1 Tax=Nonomuraea montanisoli TaxID=2741721 RepID=A0A7Y6IBB8_9ACTN|nr:MaoC family dehydratase N-terminal domain-containing protein [Nonomuraea montanisoli]NUW34345.1 MaoC family dehydratase N-terminal domain-containing protein [Nonomuraea montanisoli]
MSRAPVPRWEPHTVTTTETVDPGPVAALCALFDDGTPPVGPGDPLPPLWHWLALARWPRSSTLGPDGHPARGTFLPPVELPRRMFAGGEVAFHAPLTVGSTARRESSVESVAEKPGRSGPLVVVSVATRVYDEGGRLAIEERQDLVYRGRETVPPPQPLPETPSQTPTETSPQLPPEPAVGPAPSGAPLTRTGAWAWDLATDPTLLMRFSAATANPHRIHYDWPYATRVEGYPGLVVHGPLMTLALAEVLRLEGHGGRVERMRHRNRRPLFCGQAARLRRIGESPLTLGVLTPDSPEPCAVLTVEG